MPDHSIDLFRMTVSNHGRDRTLALAGALDLASGARLRAVADLVATQPCRAVELDISGVTFIDTAGLDALAAACRLLRGGGATPHVVGTPGRGMLRLLHALGSSGRPADLTPGAAGAGGCGPGPQSALVGTVPFRPVTGSG